MLSSQFAGKRQLEASMEQTKSKELKRQKIKEETSDMVFGATGPGSLAVGNPIIMEKIVGFLDVGDMTSAAGMTPPKPSKVKLTKWMTSSGGEKPRKLPQY